MRLCRGILFVVEDLKKALNGGQRSDFGRHREKKDRVQAKPGYPDAEKARFMPLFVRIC
jgi:hypothetical protein